jgi:hypothetical protein
VDVPYVEVRGGSIRVKWWGGEYKRDADGKPTKTKKYESASGPAPGVKFQTEDEAYDFGLDREYDVRHGRHIRRVDSKTLMEPYCWMWFEALDLRETSTRAYKSVLNARIIPYWGTDAVGDITPPEYDAWKRGLKEEARLGKISQKYVEQILMVFGMLMQDAVVKYKLRTETPVVVQRRRGKYVKKTREKKRPMRMETLHALACNAYRLWGYAGWVYIWHSAFTGMRPGESYGLQRAFAPPAWPAADPDPDRREESLERYEKMMAVRVEYQHQRLRGELALVEPKYDSHRTLVVPPFLAEMYRALMASHTSPWVFPAITGGPLLTTRFTQEYWHRLRDGVPDRSGDGRCRPWLPTVPEMAGKRIYLLRHGHKEWLDEDGHSRVAQETRMGHELAGVEGLYANVTPVMELRIAESLQGRWEEFWRRSGGLFVAPFPTPLPVDLLGRVPLQVSGQVRSSL